MSANLASRPFVNRRPIRRLGVALWLVVGIVGIVDAALYFDYFRGSGRTTRQRYLELRGMIRDEQGRIETLEAELAKFDLEAQREQIQFLNDRIAERTFGWSRLFDRLAEVLPLRVRLSNLSPRAADRRRASGPDDQIVLQLQGWAESDAALLELVQNLYAHTAFEQPALSNEFRKGGRSPSISR